MFLATTALSDFWDKQQDLLCLGTWCLREDRRNEWAGVRYQVMPTPWNDRERFYDAARFVDACYERTLARLVPRLNEIHRVRRSRRYWRILIGPWLWVYIHVLYDRFVHLRDAFQAHPSLDTMVLDRASFVVPRDMVEFAGMVCGDRYNLQLISELLAGEGRNFPARSLDEEDGHTAGSALVTQGSSRAAFSGAIRRLYGWFEGGLRRGRGKRWQVALCDMNVPRSVVWKLAWSTGMRALAFDTFRLERRSDGQPLPAETTTAWSFAMPRPAFDASRRGLGALGADSAFERLLIRSLSQNFPVAYLEGYRPATAEIDTFPKPPAVIVSANGWFLNERFKFWAAMAADRGSRLVATQHGGGYGLFRFSPHELHETRAAHVFAGWGWAGGRGAAFLNLPQLSEVGRRSRSHARPRKSILFLGPSHPRYLYVFRSSPVGSQWDEFFRWDFRFLEALPSDVRATVIFRPYPSADLGQGHWKRVTERFPEIRCEGEGSFTDALDQARLVVIDHPDTTLLEALRLDVPTVSFWDPHRWEMRSEAEPYCDELRRAGVVWDSPEAAAAKVVEVLPDPFAWWDDSTVQTSRAHFVERFALTRPDWARRWRQFLSEQVQQPGTRSSDEEGAPVSEVDLAPVPEPVLRRP